MRATLSFIVVVGVFAAAFAGMFVVQREFFGGTKPIWLGGASGAFAGVCFYAVGSLMRRSALTLWASTSPQTRRELTD